MTYQENQNHPVCPSEGRIRNKGNEDAEFLMDSGHQLGMTKNAVIIEPRCKGLEPWLSALHLFRWPDVAVTRTWYEK